VTVEHIVNDNDISLSLTREDFVKICDEQLSRLKEIVMNSLKQADITSIAAVELLGRNDDTNDNYDVGDNDDSGDDDDNYDDDDDDVFRD